MEIEDLRYNVLSNAVYEIHCTHECSMYSLPRDVTVSTECFVSTILMRFCFESSLCDSMENDSLLNGFFPENPIDGRKNSYIIAGSFYRLSSDSKPSKLNSPIAKQIYAISQVIHISRPLIISYLECFRLRILLSGFFC